MESKRDDVPRKLGENYNLMRQKYRDTHTYRKKDPLRYAYALQELGTCNYMCSLLLRRLNNPDYKIEQRRKDVRSEERAAVEHFLEAYWRFYLLHLNEPMSVDTQTRRSWVIENLDDLLKKWDKENVMPVALLEAHMLRLLFRYKDERTKEIIADVKKEAVQSIAAALPSGTPLPDLINESRTVSRLGGFMMGAGAIVGVYCTGGMSLLMNACGFFSGAITGYVGSQVVDTVSQQCRKSKSTP